MSLTNLQIKQDKAYKLADAKGMYLFIKSYCSNLDFILESSFKNSVKIIKH